MAGLSPSHGTSAVTPAVTLFSTGGGSSAEPAVKTTGGMGPGGRGNPAGGHGPLDDNVVAVRLTSPTPCGKLRWEKPHVFVVGRYSALLQNQVSEP